MKKAIKWVGFAIVTVSAMSVCNTIQGAGQDIESTGEAIEEAAN